MRIVVGLSGAPEGRAALNRAIDEAKLRGAALQILSILRAEEGESARELEQFRTVYVEAQAEAESLAQRLTADGIDVSVEVQLATSRSPAAILIEAARQTGAELLVIGIRSRSRVGKLVLGSVSQDILLAADCPVLAVKVQES